MSPQGGRNAPGKGGSGSASGAAPARRLGLLLFGVTFLVLFLVVAISEGVGDPSIPSGNVALVEDAPGDLGDVTEAELDHAIELMAAQNGESVPKPGDAKYDELKEAALFFLLEGIWLQGLVDEMGITLSDQELAAEVKKVREENFPTEASFKEFLKESKYTPADFEDRVKLQALSGKAQEKITEGTSEPTQSEIEEYYEASKNTTFALPEYRDFRLIVNKDRKKAEAARNALATDNTAGNWKKVAGEYSEEEGAEERGGQQENISEGSYGELDKELFTAPEGQLEGPVKSEQGYNVFEVTKITPPSTQSLKSAEAQIKNALEQQARQEYFTEFAEDYNAMWSARTFCAAGYVVERCSNFKYDGHPSTAPPGCYEADPKGGRPEACPAAVFQLVPAMPGSVTVTEPQGEPLAQRPRPVEGTEEAAGGGTTPPVEEEPSN